MVYALEVIRNCIRFSYMYMYVIYVVSIKITKMYKKLFAIKTTNFRICANIKNALFRIVGIIYNYVSFRI